MANINDVTSAYTNVIKQATKAAPSADDGGVSFSDVLKNSAQKAINTQYHNESISAAAVAGNASITDVLQAANEAEIALNTVLALRDRMVQAYEQVLRTPM
jgi:flagellar hook-basal body complex protein FliE